jgi:hypothetical protein
VGAGSADCDLVEACLCRLLSHGQTSIVRHEEGNCESKSSEEGLDVLGLPLKC